MLMVMRNQNNASIDINWVKKLQELECKAHRWVHITPD